MSEMSSMFNELRLQQQLCDAVIRVNEAEFHVHKVVLCSCSYYFRCLFTCWSPPDDHVFDIDHVSPDIMQLIVDFAYTGSVSVASDRIQDLFIAADRFSVLRLVQLCCDLLEDQLTPHNCISIWWFSDLYYNPELKLKAFLFILRYFKEVVRSSEDFLLLSVEELVRIIEDDRLNVRQEKTVFDAVLLWINAKPNERQELMPLLLSQLRLVRMSPDYIRDVVAETEMVKKSEECLSILRNTFELIIGFGTTKLAESSSCSPLVRPRLPPAVLLVTGGRIDSSPSAGIRAYNIRTDHWVIVALEEGPPRAFHGAAVLGGSLYCVGGINAVESLNTVDRFDLQTHTWHEVAPMHSRRSFVGVTALDGFIYALGGANGYERLRTAERYQPTTNQWTMIAAMQQQRSDASCTALRGKLYICGGFDGMECLLSAECYDPECDQWTLISNMDSRRTGSGTVAYIDQVFVLGGFNGTDHLSTAEAFDPNTNTWRAVTSMSSPRSNFGISVLDGRLFVVGGFNSLDDIAHAESYDAETKEWSDIADMQACCSGLSCCVVDGLDNMANYATPRDFLQSSSEEDGVMVG